MPNTGKSHHQPHAYPAAREKLQSQQPPAPAPPPLPQSLAATTTAARTAAATAHFVPDAPLSTRPFMTMVASTPFAAHQAPPAVSHASHHHHHYQHAQIQQRQQQHHHHAASPPQHFQSYSNSNGSSSSYPLPPAIVSQLHHSAVTSARSALGTYAMLQPTAVVVARSSNPRMAWREEIEQCARAMEGPSTLAFAGVKRAAPHSPVSSPRNAPSYESQRAAARSFAPSPSSRAFALPPPPQGTSVLPTLSCVLQRNADASSTTPSSSSHSGDSELSHHHYVSHKRQRMFAPPAQMEAEEQGAQRRRQSHEQFDYEQQYQAAAAARGLVAAPIASLYGRGDLTGADNDHLRSILEKEIAVYNQHTRQVPAARASSRYETRTTKYSRPDAIYGNGAHQSGSYEANSPGYHQDAAASPPSSSYRDQHPRRDLASRVYPIYASSGYMGTQSSSIASSHLGSDTHGDYSHTRMSTESPQQQQHARLMHRDSSLPPTQDYRNSRPDAPQTQQRRHHHYAVNGMQTQSGYDSPVPTSRRGRPGASATSSSSNSNSSSGVRAVAARTTTTTTSGYRGFVRSAGDDDNDDDPQHLSGEAVIEAASGLVEERSPSKRESITKLLLKSKEFLKAKSLVRNRNNEIDWVATFLNVGFESSSIYSLMCPLRKGRWKVEEEKYTLELLRLVESGAVRLRHGQSVRGFIAKKLHSDDMRVLKKLSNCKMFHFARTLTPHVSEEEEIDESVPGAASALDVLGKLRSEFLRSVQLEALVAVRKYLSDSSIRELLNGRD